MPSIVHMYWLIYSCQIGPLSIPILEMRQLRHREVYCLTQDHTGSANEVTEPFPLTTMVCSTPKRNGGKALQTSGHCRGIDGAEEEMAQQRNTQLRRVSRSADTGVAWKSSVGVVACALTVQVPGLLCMWQSCTLLHLLPRPHSSMDALCQPGCAESPEAGSALPFLSTCSGYNAELAHHNQVLLVGKIRLFYLQR